MRETAAISQECGDDEVKMDVLLRCDIFGPFSASGVRQVSQSRCPLVHPCWNYSRWVDVCLAKAQNRDAAASTQVALIVSAPRARACKVRASCAGSSDVWIPVLAVREREMEGIVDKTFRFAREFRANHFLASRRKGNARTGKLEGDTIVDIENNNAQVCEIVTTVDFRALPNVRDTLKVFFRISKPSQISRTVTFWMCLEAITSG